MNNPLGVSPSKGNQGTTRGKEEILLTSVGIEPTTSGLDLPLLCHTQLCINSQSGKQSVMIAQLRETLIMFYFSGNIDNRL